MELININGIDYLIKREGCTAKNPYATVHKNIIFIRIPINLQREEGFRIFCELKKRMIAKIKKSPARFKEKKNIEFHDSDRINLWGKNFIVSVKQGNERGSYAHCKDEGEYKKICISLANSLNEEDKKRHVSNLTRRVISKILLPSIMQYTGKINKEHFQVDVKKVFIKDHCSKWGSCSEKGNINLNFLLLFAPKEIFDYVVIHELAHMKVKNHSKEFWSIVQKVMPNYKEKIRWLKENGNILSQISAKISIKN